MAAIARQMQPSKLIQTATLQYRHTDTTASFTVVDASGKVVFATRSYRTDEDIAAARLRLLAYATDTQTRLLDVKGNVKVEPLDRDASTAAERRTWGRPLLEPGATPEPVAMPSRRTWGRS